MIDMPANAFFDSLFYGLFIGACLVAIVMVAQLGRYWYLLRNKFHNANFDVFLQASDTDAKYSVKCVVKKNAIQFVAKNSTDIVLFNGEFIMNPLNLKFGEGYYHRLDNPTDPNDFEAYGFMKVIVKNDWTFLVEDQNPIVGENGLKSANSLSHPAIVWKRR